MASLQIRIGPTALDSEMIVLGRCVQSRAAVEHTKSALTPDDFFQTNHATIFKAVCDIDPTSETSLLTQMTDILRKRGQLEEIGGHAWLLEVIDRAATDAVLPYHIQCIKRTSLARQIMSLAINLYDVAAHDGAWQVLADQISASRKCGGTKPRRIKGAEI